MPGESRDDFAAAIAELEASGGTDTGADTSIADTDPIEQPAADKPAPDKDRDASGRYAPKTAAKDALPADPKPAGEEPAAQVPGKDAKEAPAVEKPAAVDRAPVSWKPEEREGWEAMPAHHKTAVLRREREVDEALRVSADARRNMQEFHRIAAPYEAIFRAENTDPFRAADTLFRTAAALRTAPPAQKAALVADMVRDFNIDLEALDGALAAKFQGKAPVTDPVLRAIDEKLKPLTEWQQETQRGRQAVEQQMMAEAERTWTEFAAQNEFAEDLRQDIADLMVLATNRKQTLNLQDAYRRAMLAHPTISALVERRKPATDPAQQSAAARRAAQASASLPQNGGAPSQDGGEESDGSISGDIRASVRQLSRSQGR